MVGNGGYIYMYVNVYIYHHIWIMDNGWMTNHTGDLIGILLGCLSNLINQVVNCSWKMDEWYIYIYMVSNMGIIGYTVEKKDVSRWL